MRDIVIATTATNRSKLHNNTMPGWIKWLDNINNKKFNLRWFINIDVLVKLVEGFDVTQSNFKRLVKNTKNLKGKVTIVGNPLEPGNFLKACKRLAKNVHMYCEERITKNKNKGCEAQPLIIWLEDDWKTDPKALIDINFLIDNLSNPRTHINLTLLRNNYIWALAPSILGYELWKKIHYDGWMSQEETIDPEHCLGLHYEKNYTDRADIHNLTIITREVDEEYFERFYMNYVNSFYTFTEPEYKTLDISNEKYVTFDKVNSVYKGIDLFIRITPTFCIGGCNYGRDFMKKYGLVKSIEHDDKNDFYSQN